MSEQELKTLKSIRTNYKKQLTSFQKHVDAIPYDVTNEQFQILKNRLERILPL